MGIGYFCGMGGDWFLRSEELARLADFLLPIGDAEGFLMLLWGYIDDSSKEDTLVLSCIIAESSVWFWLEIDWEKALDKRNSELIAVGRKPITRFKAADCSSCKGEFEGWDVQTEQIPFVLKFLSILKRHRLNVVAYSINIGDVSKHIKSGSADPVAMAYVILLHYILGIIAKEILVMNDDACIGIIHDRGSYDAVFLNTFNTLTEDTEFPNRKRFNSIVSMSSESSIPLQVADLMAYENLKEVKNYSDGRKRRKSLDAILNYEEMGGTLRGINEESVIEYAEYLGQLPKQIQKSLLSAGHSLSRNERKR